MGKCPAPRCKWTGPADKFQRHYANNHYKRKKSKKQGKKGSKDKFKVPGFARRKR